MYPKTNIPIETLQNITNLLLYTEAILIMVVFIKSLLRYKKTIGTPAQKGAGLFVISMILGFSVLISFIIRIAIFPPQDEISKRFHSIYFQAALMGVMLFLGFFAIQTKFGALIKTGYEKGIMDKPAIYTIIMLISYIIAFSVLFFIVPTSLVDQETGIILASVDTPDWPTNVAHLFVVVMFTPALYIFILLFKTARKDTNVSQPITQEEQKPTGTTLNPSKFLFYLLGIFFGYGFFVMDFIFYDIFVYFYPDLYFNVYTYSFHYLIVQALLCVTFVFLIAASFK